MGEMIFEPSDNWALGAFSAPSEDQAPKGSFVVGENTVLLFNNGQSASVGKRAGWNYCNLVPQTGSPAIIGQYGFVKSTGIQTANRYHLLVGSNGRLDKLQGNMTVTAADSGTPTPFTSGYYPPSFATMNNLCFIANGVDPLHAFNGTDIWNAGLDAPATPTISAVAGAMPADTYGILTTYYDSATGVESSASVPDEVTLGSPGGIEVLWVASTAERAVTHVRTYIRQNSNQTEFFLAAETDMAALGTTIDLTQDQLDALTILAPDEDENDPPPSGLVGVETHAARLFAHDGSRVYYSNIEEPEGWDPDNFFSLNDDSGQKIMALHSTQEVLLILKESSIWALYGEDPATWVPRMLTDSVGCVNERSIVSAEGKDYWWSLGGPVVWTGGEVVNIARGRIDPEVTLYEKVASEAISPSATGNTSVGVVGTVDSVNERILWAYADFDGESNSGVWQNNVILPYNYRYNQWEATKWFGRDAASLVEIHAVVGTPHVYLGGYKGKVLRYGGRNGKDATFGGGAGGPTSGVVVSGTTSSITTSGGLYTSFGGFEESYVWVNDGVSSDWYYARVASNNADTLLLGTDLPVVPAEGWQWVEGTIGFKVEFPWQTFGAPFIRKRLEYAYFWAGCTEGETELIAKLYRDFDDNSNDDPVRTFTLGLSNTGATGWEENESFDEAVWRENNPRERFRKRLAKVCYSYKWIFQEHSNVGVVIYKVDTRAETQTDKT